MFSKQQQQQQQPFNFYFVSLLLMLITTTSFFKLIHGFNLIHQRTLPSSSPSSSSSISIINGVKKEVGTTSTALSAIYSTGRSSSNASKDRSKRQSRVGHLVRTELARILHSGIIRGEHDYLEDQLRQRISIVGVDVSPDLRQARVTVSIRNPGKETDDGSTNNNAAVDKRRAYSWLVQNTKPLRHSLAQRMSHMKTSPNLTFVQVDVGAAVDVMYLIDKASSGYIRDDIGGSADTEGGISGQELIPHGVVDGMDFDEEFDEDEWEDEDEDFF